jgi:hypothetical protein
LERICVNVRGDYAEGSKKKYIEGSYIVRDYDRLWLRL